MLLASLVFATMNIFVKLSGRLPVLELIFARSLITLFISYYNVRKSNVHPLGNNRKVLLLRGVLGTIGLTCFFYTLQRMPLATAVLIHYVAPLFTTLMASWLLGERSSWVRYLFSMISIAGIVMIQGIDPRVSAFDTMIGITGAIASAGAYNCIRILKDSEKANVIILYFPLVTLPLVTILLSVSNSWIMPEGIEWFYLLLIGGLTQMAQYYLTRAYQGEKAALVSSITYTGIIYSFFYGVVFFHESFKPEELIGILVVITGIVLNVIYKDQRN